MNKRLVAASLLSMLMLSPVTVCADNSQIHPGSQITAHQTNTSDQAHQRIIAQKLAKVYQKHGFSKEEIVGAVGVAYYETKLNPSSVTMLGNETHVGLYNWSGKAAKEMIKESPNNVPSLNTQLDYLDKTLPKHINTVHYKNSDDFAKQFLQKMGRTNVINQDRLDQSVQQAQNLLNK